MVGTGGGGYDAAVTEGVVRASVDDRGLVWVDQPGGIHCQPDQIDRYKPVYTRAALRVHMVHSARVVCCRVA